MNIKRPPIDAYVTIIRSYTMTYCLGQRQKMRRKNKNELHKWSAMVHQTHTRHTRNCAHIANPEFIHSTEMKRGTNATETRDAPSSLAGVRMHYGRRLVKRMGHIGYVDTQSCWFSFHQDFQQKLRRTWWKCIKIICDWNVCVCVRRYDTSMAASVTPLPIKLTRVRALAADHCSFIQRPFMCWKCYCFAAATVTTTNQMDNAQAHCTGYAANGQHIHTPRPTH